MLYVIAFFLPPVGLLLAGKPFQALINIPLFLLFWLPGMIHAFVVIGGKNADKRTDRIVQAMQQK